MHRRLTYANVVATLALFIALGGASYAALKLPKNSVGPKQLKKNAVTTPKIKDRAVTAAKIQVSGLGTVPSAANADHATTAGTATALSAPEPVHYIGLPGEPSFEGGFTNTSGGPPTGYFKDHDCMVHFVGEMEGEGTPAFTLPAAFRPAQTAWAAILIGGPSAAQLTINTDGRVTASNIGGGDVTYLGLDSASFRAATC